MKLYILSILLVVIITLYGLSVNATFADTASQADVAVMVVGDKQFYVPQFTVNVELIYNNSDIFNIKQYLSFHVYDKTGNSLIYENERQLISELHQYFKFNVDLSNLSLQTKEAIIVFDIVDEDDVFWFSNMQDGNHTLYIDKLTYEYSRLLAQLATIKASIKSSPYIFAFNIFVIIAVLLLIIVLRSKVRREQYSIRTKY